MGPARLVLHKGGASSAMASPAFSKQPSGWKRLAIISLFCGAGFAVVIAATIGAFIWYTSRGTPPRPWNENAIKATFVKSDVLTLYPAPGDPRSIKYPLAAVTFEFDLKNGSGLDYRLEPPHKTLIAMQRLKSGALIDGSGIAWRALKGAEEVDSPAGGPILIPAGQTARVVFDISYSKYDRDRKQPTQQQMTQFAHEQLKDIGGFVLLDEANHYRIDLPLGDSIR